MSTFLAAAAVDLALGAPVEPVLARLRVLMAARQGQSADGELLRVAVTTAPDHRHRLLMFSDYQRVNVEELIRGLLDGRPDIERAIVAVDHDEYGTEHVVIRGGGAVTTVHSVQVMNAENHAEIERSTRETLARIRGPEDDAGPPSDARPIAGGLVREAGYHSDREFDPGDGTQARAAAADLFGVPAERMEDADRTLDAGGGLSLETIGPGSTYGVWWTALGVPWPWAFEPAVVF